MGLKGAHKETKPRNAKTLLHEDGRELQLKGTERDNSAVWVHGQNESVALRHKGTVGFGLGLAFFLALVAL